ncbi:MAG: glutamine synthetase family protein [Saprospiraceae bacterium]
MTEVEILGYVQQHPGQRVKLAITDIDGILRGKYISTEKFLSAVKHNFGFCNVVFGWDTGDAAYDNSAYTGWHSGYPDAPAKIDLNTFRKIPWENDLPFFLCELVNEKDNPDYVCPRTVLKKVIDQAGIAGFTPYFSQEFEWFNFQETPHSAQDKRYSGLRPLSPGMFGYSILRTSLNNDFFSVIFDQLRQFDIPLEGLHTETGPGVLEAAITYSKVLEAADRAVLFKTAVKELAYRQGIMATFMAKWDETLPGCSGHVHQSLWNKEASLNLFHSQKNKKGMSELFSQYIAGQLFCMPHILPLFAPTVNSFKRLVEGAWAPTTLTWDIDNRTVALRALPGSSKSSRLETRVVGSDVNPYLAMAACLASGLYGIENKLKLQPSSQGNGYKDLSHGVLPANLWEATQAMKKSVIAKELFGAQFVDHFVSTREWEWRLFSKVVTDWEKKRHFEII